MSSFYKARALRLAPVYYFLAILLAAGNYLSPKFWRWALELDVGTVILGIVSHVTIVGQDILIFLSGNGGGRQPISFILNPPSWSLSLEIMFYILAPFLWRCRTSVLVALLASSFGLRLAFYLNYAAVDPWTYRFFPFEISIFLAGMVAYRLIGVTWSRTVSLFATAGFAVFLAIYTFAPVAFAGGFNINASVLLIVSFLAVPFLFSFTKDLRYDRFIGELSYPIYLVHIPLTRLYGKLTTHPYIFVLASILAGLLLHVAIERNGGQIVAYVANRLNGARGARGP